MSAWEIVEGDCVEVLRSLESGSVSCVITSPPYKCRRLRLWCGRWGVEKATALRLITDRKKCSCPMCNRGRGLGGRLRLAAAEAGE